MREVDVQVTSLRPGDVVGHGSHGIGVAKVVHKFGPEGYVEVTWEGSGEEGYEVPEGATNNYLPTDTLRVIHLVGFGR
jgi:hypothetical protein